MRKKIISVILTVGLVVSMLGCGSNEQDRNVVSTDVESSITETVESDPVDMTKTKEAEKAPKNSEETEVAYSAEDYEEQKDIFVYGHIDSGDGTKIDFTNEEQIDGPFILSESIDIYSYFFTYAGYTKPDIKVDVIRRVGEWIFVPFAKSSFLVKAEDFDRVASLEAKKNTDYAENSRETGVETPSVAIETSENDQADNNVGSSGEMLPVSEVEPQTEAPAVTTYSEEEVISIFRSTLESNGIQWYPSVYPNSEAGPSGGMGWGIENISMTDPYGDSAKSVEGFQFAGWNLYYLESQGSSDGYVHLKLYSGTN